MRDQKTVILEEIQDILLNSCDSKVQLEEDLIIAEDLGLDSIAVMTFVMSLEERYGISLDELESPPETVADLLCLVQQNSN